MEVTTIDKIVMFQIRHMSSRLRGLVRDGEQHWAGGTVDYFQGGSDVSEPDEGDSEEDGYDKLGEHFRNQNF